MDCITSQNSCTIIEISDDEEGEVKIQKSSDFYSNELKQWIDIKDTENDWTLVDFDSNIDYIFKKLKDKFFPSIDSVYVAQFDNDNAIMDGSAFMIFEQSKRILLSRSILTRPRIQQISIILHILIHLFLNKASNGQIGINMHEENFRSIMHHLNNLINTNIACSHDFIYQQGEENYHKQWWMCSGNCQHYEPFKGIFRCTIMPNESMLFWRTHIEKCTGIFFKIFKVQKTNALDEVNIKYVRNTCYANIEPCDEEHPIRAIIDLTSDIASPIVCNLFDTIDLVDETEYNINDEATPKYFEEFKKIPLDANSCPFCLVTIGTNRLSSHFDVCMGYQQEVKHCIRPFIPKPVSYANVH